MAKVRFKTSSSPPRKGDVYLVMNLEFNDTIGCKGRPIVVTCVKGDAVSFRRCTTKHHDYENVTPIMDTVEAGLLSNTYVCERTEQISKHRLTHRLGKLSVFDRKTILGEDTVRA